MTREKREGERGREGEGGLAVESFAKNGRRKKRIERWETKF